MSARTGQAYQYRGLRKVLREMEAMVLVKLSETENKQYNDYGSAMKPIPTPALPLMADESGHAEGRENILLPLQGGD
jgi:hypothetical protein